MKNFFYVNKKIVFNLCMSVEFNQSDICETGSHTLIG